MNEDDEALLAIADVLADKKVLALSKLRRLESAAIHKIHTIQNVKSDAQIDPTWMTRPLAASWSIWANSEIEKTNLSIARIRAQMPATEQKARLAFGRSLALRDVLKSRT